MYIVKYIKYYLYSVIKIIIYIHNKFLLQLNAYILNNVLFICRFTKKNSIKVKIR